MALIGNIRLNTGQNINIPDIEWGTAGVIGLNQSYWYYSNGNNPATQPYWGDIISKINAKGPIANSWSGVYDLFMDRSAHPASYWNEGAGKTWLDNVRAHTYFIFGSLDNGGVFICKDSGNRYYIIALRGTFNDDSTQGDDYAYWFMGTPGGISDGLTASELQTAFFIQYDDINGSPKLWIFYTPNGLGWRNYDANAVPTSTYIGTTLDECLAISSWEDCLPVISLSGTIPVNMFVCSDITGETVYSSQGYKVIGSDGAGVYPQYSHRAGSILGGSKISSSENPYNSTSTTSPTGDPWDDTSDPIPGTDEDQFTIDALNSGFYTLYNPDKTQIKAFNNYLFSDITDAMSQVLKRLISNPIEYVVFCAMCHFTPPSSDTAHISFCGLDSGINANLISKQMHPIDCGSVELFYIGEDGLKHDDTSSFLSYDPYYKIQIYLPYIGIKDIKTSDVMRGTLSVKYWVDLLTGACIAQLTVNRSSRGSHDVNLDAVIAEFTGNCYEHLPMSATDWRGMASAIMQFAGGAASLASGNAAGLGTMASAVMAEKVTVARSGQLAANYGYMGCQTPYLIISRAINQTPENFKEWEGLPSNITYGISELSGYTEIDPNTLWVNNIPGITEREADMIRSICNEGIII